MAKLKDLYIDSRARESIREAYRDLYDLSQSERAELAQRFGVQVQTLDGWIEGRGNPIPKAAEGHWLYDGTLYEEWQDRAILGALLLGATKQTGKEGRLGVYRDDISGSSLSDVIDRVKDYLGGGIGDEYLKGAWRKLTAYQNDDGSWDLEVDYARVYDE